MTRRQRLQEARLAEARLLYLHARTDAGIARLRMRLGRHRVAWVLAGGFGAGVVAGVLRRSSLLWLAVSATRIIGFVRLPFGMLARVRHERAHAHANAHQEHT